MDRNTKCLAEQRFDLVVIGGGVNGLCAAWDAALRGYQVALVEKNDFGGATSAGSFRIVHGGFRYLQNLDLPRLRRSVRERCWFLRAAPHLVAPQPFLIPCRGNGLRSRAAFGAALKLYDGLAADRNRGVDPARAIPPGRLLSQAETREALGDAALVDATGGALFYDALMLHSERLTLAFALAAARAGAQVVNYAEAKKLLREGGRVAGVGVEDRLSGETIEVRASVVLNMAGPWSGALLDRLGVPVRKESFRLCRGAQVLVRKPLVREVGLGVELRGSGGGRRLLFLRPWRDMTWIGTSEEAFDGEADEFAVTDRDIEDLLRDVNRALPGAALSLDDVVTWNGGLRPIDEPAPGNPRLSLSDRDRIRVHAEPDDGLVTVVGVKYTTARSLAQGAVDAAIRVGRLPAAACKTAEARLPGGDIDNWADFSARRTQGLQADAYTAGRLLSHYGSDLDALLKGGDGESDGLHPLPECPDVTRAEILHAVRHEMAQTCADVVLRRTDMASAGHPGRAAIEACAHIMAGECGWSTERVAKEVEEVERALALTKGGGQ